MKDVMLDHVIAFPNQLRESLEIGRNATITPSDKKFNKVVVLGMGGSGFGADLVSELVAGELAIPYLGIKDYEIPNHIDENTYLKLNSQADNLINQLSKFINYLKNSERKGAKFD